MKTIRKTGKTGTYFEGNFCIYTNKNMARPINFPTVFTAFGAGIKSGNWSSCTGINTPQYVIDNYFDGNMRGLVDFWPWVFALENITWIDVEENPLRVELLIDNANNELNKLKTL